MTTPSGSPLPPTPPDIPHHTDADLRWLQDLFDDSHRRAGEHLRGIHTAPARVGARDLAQRLTGMFVAVVATVSSDGRPFTGPVDAFLHHGRVFFGTSPLALRSRHLQARPGVSVTHVQGEALVLTVHGRARPADLTGSDGDIAARLRAHYGPEWWDDIGDGAAYYVVEPDRVFAADMSVHLADSA